MLGGQSALPSISEKESAYHIRPSPDPRGLRQSIFRHERCLTLCAMPFALFPIPPPHRCRISRTAPKRTDRAGYLQRQPLLRHRPGPPPVRGRWSHRWVQWPFRRGRSNCGNPLIGYPVGPVHHVHFKMLAPVWADILPDNPVIGSDLNDASAAAFGN